MPISTMIATCSVVQYYQECHGTQISFEPWLEELQLKVMNLHNSAQEDSTVEYREPAKKP